MSNDLDEDQLLADSDEDSSSSEEDEDGGGGAGVGSSVTDGVKCSRDRVGAASFFSGGDGVEDEEEDSGDEDSDDVDDEEMDVDEDALLAELGVVNDKLAAEPYSYDLYLEKMRILKELGDMDRLRSVREKMSEIYPLSPNLWVAWLQDEQKMLSVATSEEKEYVFTLMERAVKDYASVEVWLEYVNLCLSNMSDENGNTRCRDVFERAITCCGLNVAMGSLIWDTYRDFEAALLSTMITEEKQLEQEQRYISLCKRQLAVPLLGMKDTFDQLRTKIELDENTEDAYKKAMERLKDLESWEAKLVQAAADSDKLKVYNDYIVEEKRSKSNPARIQCLYERAITDSPLTTQLWLDYVDYLCKNLKIPEVILEVCERSSRNCSWTLAVWMKYLWAVETFVGIALGEGESSSPVVDDGNRFEKLKSVFEKALTYCGGVAGDQAGTLWLKYLEFLRRRIDYENPDQKKLEILRKTFSAAETHLLQLVEEPNEYICQILQFQARFETNLTKSITKEVHEMWKNMLHRGYGQYFRVWSQYLSLQIKFGADIKTIRTELGRAMAQVKDDPRSVADLWLNFERDFGDIITLSNSETKIAKELEKVMYEAPPAPGQNYNNTNYAQKDSRMQSEKGKKRKWNNFDEPTSSRNTVPPHKKERPSRSTIDAVDSVTDNNGTFKVPAIPRPKSFNSTDKQNSGSSSSLPPSSDLTPPPGPVKHDHSKDNRTVFISNLDFSVDEATIKGFFTDCGVVEEVRLVKDFKLRSKGFGYVVFEKPESINKALAMDRKPLGSRPVFVSKCDPDNATRQVQFKYSTALEKNKLFVKGLPFSMTGEDLNKLFAQFGSLKDCRLVTNRSGNPKGLAYVEFGNASDAAAAILKTDNTVIDGRTISVAISNPPTKNDKNAFNPQKFTSSRTTRDPQQRRERNAFVPRSVQVHSHKPEAATGSTSTSSNEKTAPKTNDDFRKMFMKK